MDTQTDPNTAEQSAWLSINQNQITTTEWMDKKFKVPILSDRVSDLTKINLRMWWEQISEYIDLTCHRNLDEVMDQGIEYLDAHTVYDIEDDVT